MKTQTILIGIALLALVAVIVFITQKPSPAVTAEPTNFEECAAKYPVMESYPRQCNTPSGLHFTETVTPEEHTSTDVEGSTIAGIPDLITVNAPTINSKVESPLTLTGSARGTWYFEASFPIEVRNSVGTVIATGHAEATSDWMTEDFVPFTATITFPAQPAGSTGTVVLKNDNPSGDPARDKSVVIPVTF